MIFLNRKFILCLFLSFGYTGVCHAEIFSWQDAHGHTHYSDKPHDNAQVLAIKPGYSYYRVEKIYDGDTVQLENGQKVRLLGINTPEIGGHHKNVEAGGESAKKWLTQRLTDVKVRMEKDLEEKDKYGRLLAHLFTEDKSHINLELVRLGLASISIYPPNLKYTEALIAAQQQAQQEQRGLWGLPEYAPKPISALTEDNTDGWQRLTGQVSSIKETRGYYYLNMAANFNIRIAKQTENLFPPIDSYRGKKLEVRGWLNKYQQGYSMLIRHPSAILTLDK